MRRVMAVAAISMLGACASLSRTSDHLSAPPQGVSGAVTATVRWPFAKLMGDGGEIVRLKVTGADGEVSDIPMRVCRPPGGGNKNPVAIINHGGPPRGEARSAMTPAACGSPPARFFLAHGYIAAFPLRRGYGDPDTAWAQDPGSCASPDYVASALEGARDIDAAVTAALALPDARPGGMVVVGEDEGGWAVLGYAVRPRPAVAAFIVMGAGEGGRAANMYRRTCRPDLLIAAARQLGAVARTRMLWIAATDDPVYSPELSRALRDAFAASGDDVAFAEPDHVPGDAHDLLFTQAGVLAWGPLVARFLSS